MPNGAQNVEYSFAPVHPTQRRPAVVSIPYSRRMCCPASVVHARVVLPIASCMHQQPPQCTWGIETTLNMHTPCASQVADKLQALTSYKDELSLSRMRTTDCVISLRTES